jgi:glycine dehydrogenase subunit 2
MTDHGTLASAPETSAAVKNRRRRFGSLFDESHPGRKGVMLPALDVPEADPAALFGDEHRAEVTGEVEANEVDVVRHFTRLSQLNFAIDTALYPLGSCTMKHNPRINEEIARLAGSTTRTLTRPSTFQGNLELLYRLEKALIALTGFSASRSSPRPVRTASWRRALIRAAHVAAGNAEIRPRADSAHGTNPATAHFAGYKVIELKSSPQGTLDLAELSAKLTDEVAALMITVPNTIGVFESHILEITKMCHEKGALVYLDGANFNSFVGKVRPADMGADVMHMNLHKTFSTPHSGVGPGAGPVGVGERLVPFLPAPTVRVLLPRHRPAAVHRAHAFNGNFGVSFARSRTSRRTATRSTGGRNAVLNANYIRKRLEPFHLKFDAPSYHEVVFDDKKQAARHPQHRHRQAALELRFPPAHDVVPLIVRSHDRATEEPSSWTRSATR